jgi:hypothetical protein
VADIMARNDGRYNWYTNTYWIGRDRVLGARGCSDIRVKVTPVMGKRSAVVTVWRKTVEGKRVGSEKLTRTRDTM